MADREPFRPSGGGAVQPFAPRCAAAPARPARDGLPAGTATTVSAASRSCTSSTISTPRSRAGRTEPPSGVRPSLRAEFYWAGHNPIELVESLAHTWLYVTVGDGRPAPNEIGNLNEAFREAYLRTHAEEFMATARAAGLDVTYETRQGIHDWPYCRHHLAAAIRWGFFKPVRERPKTWTYETWPGTARPEASTSTSAAVRRRSWRPSSARARGSAAPARDAFA